MSNIASMDERASASNIAGLEQGLLRVSTERGERSYVVSTRTQPDATPPILDWRMAPLAEAFFRAGPGEPYELEGGQEGKVLERWIVDKRGEGGEKLIGDMVVRVGDREEPRARPAPVQIPQPDRSALVILDPEQQRAVDLPADTSLVVDGEAGVGKTLVALYRIASLQRRAEEKSRRFRALVLVPTEGLRRLCRLIADRLGLEKLEIAVLDPWLVARAHEAFPGLPKRLSEGATAQVIALKRHPAVRVVLDDFIDWKPPKELDEKLPRSRARLLHLWGDRDRLLRVLEASGGVLQERAITAAQKHTRIQFETTTEKQHRHVDSDRLVALDGRKLDAGTAMEDVHSFDAEDVPVLFELVRRGALPEAKKLRDYDHIVIDEAQLRSPLELAAIGDALVRGGTVTLAGDHRQATDETAYFTSWAESKKEVRAQRWSEITLAVTYRSVPAIGDFARHVSERGARVPGEPPPDSAVWASACPGHLAQAAMLCWHLDALQTRDPWRQIAVIARNPDHARRLYTELSRGLDPTLVLDGDFRFDPGVIVTTASAVSGLEFDCVVIPDLTPAFYPPLPELVRSLYVAATRARDWLWLLTPDTWSPLVALQ
jgi:DNA helicase II / ATP-dependent DNA helicase PcrA